MAFLFADKTRQWEKTDGTPAASYYLHFCTVGTTTPAATYPTEADAEASTNANPNPITLNSAGRPDNGGTAIDIWLNGRRRMILSTSATIGAGTEINVPVIEDAVSASDSQGGATIYATAVGGTADAITATFSPTLGGLVNGMVLGLEVTAANTTTTPTLNADGTGAKSIVRGNGLAPSINEWRNGDQLTVRYDSGGNQYQLVSVTSGALTLGGPLNGAARVDVASVAGTTNLETALSNYIRITGTNTITAFTLSDGHWRDVLAGGAFSITAGASLIIPGVASGATITLAAGDTFRIVGESSSVVRVLFFTRSVTGARDGLLSTTTASAAASADITLPSGYQYYEVRWDATVDTDAVEVVARIGTGAGPTYQSNATDYEWEANDTVGGANAPVNSTGDSSIQLALNVGNAATEGCDGRLTIFNPANTARHKTIIFDTAFWNSTATPALSRRAGSGSYNAAATAITGIQIRPLAGTITGTFKLYGYA